MSRLHVLQARDYPRMAWKNGAGFTEEIARDQGQGLDGFGWRLSIADIQASGAFSSFTSYQRIITVLQGDGMRLSVDGQLSRPLLPFDGFAFDGASQVDCQLIGGPIRDFNLIYAPQRYRARLQWLKGVSLLHTSASTVLLFAGSPAVEVKMGHQTLQLGRHDCLHLEGNEALLALDVQGQCCLIELDPR